MKNRAKGIVQLQRMIGCVVVMVAVCCLASGCRYSRVAILGAEGASPVVLDAASQIADMYDLEQKEVSFDELPPVCKEVYNQELLKMRDATTTIVIWHDIDCDGKKELLAWDGNPGTGGGGWFVFVWDGKAWRGAGSMQGSPCGRADGKPGVFSSWACGWDAATVNYFELEGFKLIHKASFEVEYAKPIRQEPQKIRIM